MIDLASAVLRKISTPVYYRKYIDGKVDIFAEPWQCCPFPDHDDSTASWHYNKDKDFWFCHGKCHTGGNVIHLHKKWNHFRTYEDAAEDLAKILGIKLEAYMGVRDDMTRWDDVEYKLLISKIERACKTATDFCEFDNVMSFFEPKEQSMKRLGKFYADLLSNNK